MEKDEKSEDRDEFLRAFVRKSLEQAMGWTLDTFRMTEISDRAMNQITRTMKDRYNDLINYMIGIMEQKGYIKTKE